jgi:hypothetical protein
MKMKVILGQVNETYIYIYIHTHTHTTKVFVVVSPNFTSQNS